jgi:hypothetical protein
MRPISRRLTAFGAAAALGLGLLAVPALADNADTDDQTSSDTATTTDDDPADPTDVRPRRDRVHEQRVEQLAVHLADELDVDEADVEAALDGFHEQRMVERDQLREQRRDQAGDPAQAGPGRGMRHGGHGMGDGSGRQGTGTPPCLDDADDGTPDDA